MFIGCLHDIKECRAALTVMVLFYYLLIIQHLFEFIITNFAFCNILTVVQSRGVSVLHVLVK